MKFTTARGVFFWQHATEHLPLSNTDTNYFTKTLLNGATSFHTTTFPLDFNKKNCARKDHASKRRHTYSLLHTSSQSHMGHRINKLAVLMSAVE